MNDKIDSNAVFERIKLLYGISSDAAMARHLDIAPQDIPRFRKTGNIPYKQILNVCRPLDWTFILMNKSLTLPEITVDRALDVLAKAGYRVTIEKK